ncbi:hypothetical protein NHX12_003831 [Muraenolepis orangiensis]|uniref:TIR domain-containing protein n=1 Tax=Muraenolepis orangiensis TaxID=630683 RepID=A0A9Q0DU25_9TELE|nr:hypothetical protein NHX12_003831 [Muraenolepis orangiensis]
MDVKVEETPGTGVTDVVRLLLDLPTEQLLSLTFQLGDSPEEDIVHGLSLLLLHKETQGLDRLQALQDNCLANHLAKKWQTDGGKLEHCGEHGGHLDSVVVLQESLAHLARVFKVLSEKRLCDPRLRDLAYWRAVSVCDDKTSHSKVHHLIDEAKVVCGPQFAEKMLSRSKPQPQDETGKESTALSLSHDKPEINFSMPTTLQTSSSFSSYPTHLEISMPSTAVVNGDQIPPVRSQQSHPSTTPQSVGADELENNAPGSYHSSNSSETPSTPTSENASTPCSITTTTPPVRSKSSPARPESATHKITVPTQTVTGKDTEQKEGGEEEEEEEEFYAFVILHAAEDDEMADAMKERMESACGGGLAGATFSEDFAHPGKSSLRCVSDAIDNSAFTFLLLTKHFPNTRRFQVETDSALINSIQQRHKYNTVIPLLPRKNCINKASMPIVLQTLVPLEENKSFDKKIKKVLSEKKVQEQRSIWLKEQQLKKELRKQERMKLADAQRKALGDVHVSNAMLTQERLRHFTEITHHMHSTLQGAGASSFPCPMPGWQPQNIHIENSKYIVIGNDSTLSVDFGSLNLDHVVEGEDN